MGENISLQSAQNQARHSQLPKQPTFEYHQKLKLKIFDKITDPT